MRNVLLVIAMLFACLPAPGQAAERCNVHGCWQPGGGCNVHGCWQSGGGCNVHGCWNSPVGSCNVHGCSDWGECNVHGCPPPPQGGRRRLRTFVQPVPVPVSVPVPVAPPAPRYQAPAADYAQEGDEVASVVRHYEEGGLRFDYPAQFSATTTIKEHGTIVLLDGPRWLDGHITRLDSKRDPETVRRELVQSLGSEFLERGLRALGSTAISAQFADGSHAGVRVRYDNRSDIIVQDSYAWRRADGSVIVVLFSYEASEAGAAGRLYPVITRSLQ